MPILSLLATLPGCGPEPVSDYVLTLVPAPLGNQGDDILALEPDVKVRLTFPDGQHEVYYAGTAREGEALDLGELPPVPAETVVALIAEAPGGPTDIWNRTATIAYGEAILTEDLALGGEEVELTIPWARVDAVARLGALADADRRVSAALVRFPGPSGSVLVFGGASGRFGAAVGSSVDVLELARTEEGWADSFVLGGTMPATWHGEGSSTDPNGVVTGRNVGMSATPIEVDGRTMALVAGGRYPTDTTAFHNPYWFLWDPEAGEIEGGGLPDEGSDVRPDDEPGCVAQQTCGELSLGRSEHVALPLGANKVLLYGGMNGYGLPVSPTYEIWNANTRAIQSPGSISGAAPFYVSGAALGSGAVVCGGVRFEVGAQVDRWIPSDRCFSFRPNDGYTELEPLREAVAGAALAPLPDGGLLITGGFDVTVESATDFAWVDTPAAIGKAWRWNPNQDAWSRVGDLVEPRAFHRALPLADGRVMLVGGTAVASVLFGPLTDDVRCAEVFDPETDTFSRTACNAAGSGAFPAVGGDPVTGWAVLEGLEGAFQDGGSVYGLIGGQPLE